MLDSKTMLQKALPIYFKIKKKTTSMPGTLPETQAQNTFLLNRYSTELNKEEREKKGSYLSLGTYKH